MTRQEKISLLLVSTSTGTADEQTRRAHLEKLDESELDRMTALIQLRAQQAETERSRVRLELVRDCGLRNNVPANWTRIAAKLGQNYSVQQFRAAIETDDQFRNSLVWDSEPFASAKLEEKQDQLAEQTKRRQFSATVKALTGQGVRNVADTDANYRIAMDQLDDVLVSGSATTLAEAIALGLIEGLAPNNPEDVSSMDQANRAALLQSVQSRLSHSQYGGPTKNMILKDSTYADLRERVLLVGELADSHSPDKTMNDNFFCSMFCSVRDLSQLRSDVSETRERKRLRGLSVFELKQESQRVRQFDGRLDQIENDQTPEGFRRIRPESRFRGLEINYKNIARLDREDLKQLLRIYGSQEVNRVISETRGF